MRHVLIVWFMSSHSHRIILDVSIQHARKVHDKYKYISICISDEPLFEWG